MRVTQPGPPTDLGRYVDEHESPIKLFANVQEEIIRRFHSGRQQYWPDQSVSDPPPLLHDLRAIYEMDSQLILVMRDMEPDDMVNRLNVIDWLEVADRVAGQYRSLHMAYRAHTSFPPK